MIERILELIKKFGITNNKLLSDLKLPISAISEWKKGKAKPSVDALVKIADYFNVSVDYLLGRSNDVGFNYTPDYTVVSDIIVDLPTLFDINTDRGSYLMRIWESFNECYTAHSLCTNLIQYNPFKNDKDWFFVFKYSIMNIYEATTLILLNKELKENNEIAELNKQITYNLQKEIETLNMLLKDNYFRTIRHLVAHFDRTGKDTETLYKKYVSSLAEKEFDDEDRKIELIRIVHKNNQIFTIEKNYEIFVGLMHECYKAIHSEYKKSDCTEIDKVIMNDYYSLSLTINKILNGMINNYAVLRNNSDEGEMDVPMAAYGIDNKHYIPEDDEDEIKTT